MPNEGVLCETLLELENEGVLSETLLDITYNVTYILYKNGPAKPATQGGVKNFKPWSQHIYMESRVKMSPVTPLILRELKKNPRNTLFEPNNVITRSPEV